MRTLSALVLLAGAPAVLGAQSLDARLQHTLDSLHAAGRFIGVSAGVALADGRVIALASGRSDTALGTMLRPTDRMLAGSTGKTFFAALAWQLAAEGRLPLDAPISRWLGEEGWFDSLPNAREITVRTLMNHTSGLVRYEFDDRFLNDLRARPDRTFTPVEELRYLFGTAAAFTPGNGWDYSDTNYIVLAMILERIIGGRAYDEIIRRFTGPLGLARTIPQDRPDLPDLAQGYAGPRNPFGPWDAMVVNGRFALNPQFEWAGGGWATTGGDLARWARALYTTVVDSAFLRREVLAAVDAPALGRGARYGLGVIVRDTPWGPAWGHSGFFPGYLTEMRFFPDRGVAIAVMVNQNRPGRGPAALVSDLARVALGEP